MAMSSGKSSSMVAVLLLLAVVAGTCASGAQAQFTITNLCNQTVVINTNTSTSTLLPGGGLNVPGLPNQFFTDPVTVTTTGTGTPPVTVPIPIPQSDLDLLNKLGVQLQNVEIQCEGNCITFLVTFLVLLVPVTIPVTVPMGPFCPSN